MSKWKCNRNKCIAMHSVSKISMGTKGRTLVSTAVQMQKPGILVYKSVETMYEACTKELMCIRRF